MRYIAGTQHMSPSEAMRALGVTRAVLYSLVRTGKLRATWFGGRLYLPALEVERFQADETERTAERIGAKLLRAMGVKVRLLLAWPNGKGRG